MTNAEIARVLQEIGDLLAIQGENEFKCRAYYQAARNIDTCQEEISRLVAEQRLHELPGIGSALQEKITQLVQQGRLPYLAELQAAVPAELMTLLQIPGLGPKKVGWLYRERGIDSLAKLSAVCQDGSLAAWPGFGAKSSANILAGIAQIQSYAGLHRYTQVIGLAEELVDTLWQHPLVVRVALAGSLRRGLEVVKDMDLLASSKHPATVMEDFVQLPEVEKIVSHGPTKSSVVIAGVACDLRVVDDKEFASTWQHFTGSKEHNIALRRRATALGYQLNEYGLTPTDGAEVLRPRSEEELYQQLGLDYIPPELRENLGELAAAEARQLPRLVEWTQLKGCFHNHTIASDGQNSLEEMANAAASIGLSYLGIADHSQSSKQANGLDAKRLLVQVAAINEFNAQRDDITLLAGVECDILADGQLDFPDEILAQLDYVVAAVHSHFNQDEATMTRRVIKAMENPHVTMLAHPTGRLLLRRDPYRIQIPSIIEAAAETGTWLELNANPMRLDLDWRYWRQAKERGVKCVINPDAHSIHQLGYLKPAIQIARKGWLEACDIVNCLPLNKLQKLIK